MSIFDPEVSFSEDFVDTELFLEEEESEGVSLMSDYEVLREAMEEYERSVAYLQEEEDDDWESLNQSVEDRMYGQEIRFNE